MLSQVLGLSDIREAEEREGDNRRSQLVGCCVLRRTVLQMNQSGALAPVCTFVVPGVRNGLWATVLGQSAAWSTALA